MTLLLNLAVASLVFGLVACGAADDRSVGVDSSDVETSAEVNVGAELEVVTDTLPDGVAGTDYGPLSLVARGGEPPYTWSIVGGDEPRPGFLDAEAGLLAGVLAVAGDFELTFEVSDARGQSRLRTLSLIVHAPASFDSALAAPIADGEQWLGDFIVRAGDVVTLEGGTTLNVVGALAIEVGGRLEVANCGALTINHLSRSQPAEILGDLTNACADEGEPGGDLVLRSVAGLRLGGDDEGQPGLIASSGELFIGDPFYRPRPEPEVLTYVATVEPAEVPPVCAVRLEQVLDGSSSTLPLAVSIAVDHADPDGGATAVTRVDWGDATVTEAPSSLAHDYTEPGLHEILVTVEDDEGQTCTASLTVFIPDAPIDEEAPEAITAWRGPSSVWAVTDDFDGPALVQPVGVPFVLTSLRSDPDASAVWHVDGETIECPTGEHECTVAAAFSSPGVHEIVLATESLDGERTLARLTMFAPLEGGETEQADPPAPELPFPALPPSWSSPAPEFRAAERDKSHGDTCVDCALCTDPAAATGPWVQLGSTQLRAWGQGGGSIIIGLSTGTIVINPALIFTSWPGDNGGRGENGKPSRGFAAATYSGKIVLCGGRFNGAPGGHGGPNPGPRPNGVVRGGNGAPWFGVLFVAPEGSISYCGRMTVKGAKGGDGGAATNDVAAGPGAQCKHGDSAVAVGGGGGLGGGGIAYLASSVCFDAAYEIEFDCDDCLGGSGGDARATGQTPQPCTTCDEYAGRGGDATAIGGRGGRSVWYFVTRPDLAPLDPVVYVDHLRPRGIYWGGDGGDADATAGDGGDSTCNGCSVEYSWAGRGGHAYATGGRARYGMSGRGTGGDADATSGSGGAATSTPLPGKALNGCPGERGCTLYGFGGRSGIARAWPGEGVPDGVQTLVSGVGGDATVTGGDGGDGAGCPACDGGRGGKAVAVAGRDPQGLPTRVDGTATATGGTGGDGSTCCAPPKMGGDGGRGGDGVSQTGPAGVNALRGGDGGDGGDGDGEPTVSGGGAMGLGMGTPIDIPNGSPGLPGGLCPVELVCPVPGPDCCNVDADCGAPSICAAYHCVDHACILVLLTGDPCDDGDACTTQDQCVEGICQGIGGGECVADEDCVEQDPCTIGRCSACGICEQDLVDCDDHISCTQDLCVADGNAPRCEHVPDDGLCGQGDACTELFCDPNEGCLEVVDDCDDDNVCTIDSCNPATGCTHQAITCPAAPVCQHSVCDPGEGCGTANLTDGTPCGGDMLCSQGACVPRLARVIGDCWIALNPGQAIDVTAWVSGGAGATTVSLPGGSPGHAQTFTLSGTTLSVKTTSPGGFAGDQAVYVRIQRGAEVVDILVVARFGDPGGSQGATLTGTDGSGPTAPVTGVVELSSSSPPFAGFIQGDGAGWVCDESSCAWCWASSLSVSTSIGNMAIGGHCDPACGGGQTCVVEAGNPVCRGVDSAQSATCQANGTGNVFIVGTGCRWLSLSFDELYIDPPASSTAGNQLVDVGAPFSIGPVPAQSGCGFIAFRYRFTASPPLGCFERLQAGGSGVLGLDVLVIVK